MQLLNMCKSELAHASDSEMREKKKPYFLLKYIH